MGVENGKPFVLVAQMPQNERQNGVFNDVASVSGVKDMAVIHGLLGR